MPTLEAPVFANQAELPNDNGGTLLVFVNGIGGAGDADVEVTITQVACPHDRLVAESAFDVTLDTVAVLGPWPPLLYNQSDGMVDIDYEDSIDAAHARVFGLRVL
jgi:hypothetical protein